MTVREHAALLKWSAISGSLLHLKNNREPVLPSYASESAQKAGFEPTPHKQHQKEVPGPVFILKTIDIIITHAEMCFDFFVLDCILAIHFGSLLYTIYSKVSPFPEFS